ncbi:putative superfamily III holin-X [Roseimicrobium gellanilyticum]|uniref:Putative superfamily III holin-X n=1 Tax=Roseimicrobium gellanilyticum TaxID=748857 RepID=A0A366HUD8_9BACT|nr:phage holin family protein [Roseimicrobium gellanilyticum]RBP47460.1 putative superfamily III holin-X [Roseimicrobium gellanilyticum]
MHASSPPSWSSHLDRGNSLSDSVRTLLSSLVTYLETRWKLFKVESGEAMRLGIQVAVVTLFALACAFVMYVCAMVGVTLWIAHQWWDGAVMPAAFIMAGVHLLLLLSCAGFIIWSLRGRKLFHDTRTEFKEDKRWLHLQTTSNV